MLDRHVLESQTHQLDDMLRQLDFYRRRLDTLDCRITRELEHVGNVDNTLWRQLDLTAAGELDRCRPEARWRYEAMRGHTALPAASIQPEPVQKIIPAND